MDYSQFPMVMAVPQSDLNHRLGKIFDPSHNPSNKTFPKDSWILEAADKSWKLEVHAFKPPMIRLAMDLEELKLPANRSPQKAYVKDGVTLKLVVAKGTFHTYDVDEVGLLGKKSIDLEPGVLELSLTTTISDIVHTSWSDNGFDVQSLLNDLSIARHITCNLNLVALQQMPEVVMAGTANPNLEKLIADRIREIGTEDPKARLFPEIEVASNSEGNNFHLAPDEVAHSVYQNSHQEQRENYLNYWLYFTGDSEKGKVPVKNTPIAKPKLLSTSDIQMEEHSNSGEVLLLIPKAIVLDKSLNPFLQHYHPGMQFFTDLGDNPGITPPVLRLKAMHPTAILPMAGDGPTQMYILKVDTTIIDGDQQHSSEMMMNYYAEAESSTGYHNAVNAYRLWQFACEDSKMIFAAQAPVIIGTEPKTDCRPCQVMAQSAFGKGFPPQKQSQNLDAFRLPGYSTMNYHTQRFTVTDNMVIAVAWNKTL